MWFALALIALVFVSVLFHFVSPWWFTPIASNWGTIDDALIITFVICATVFVSVNLFMAYAVFRYRHREGSKAAYEPESVRLEKNLTIWTAVGIAGMLAPGLYAWFQYITVPDEAVVVEAIGEQWQWSFRLPGQDGVLGTVDTRFISFDNPFGVNPDDPAGRDDRLVESNELHIAVDQPVKMLLRSKDVLHNFYVPEFRGKMDLVPGLVSYFWFTPTETGNYEIICAEFCGVGHYSMRGRVIVDDAASYQAWVDGLPTFAQLLADAR